MSQSSTRGHVGKATLLFVDDDPDTLDMYERMMANDRYRILKATSADEARNIVEQESVDIAIVDMMMPEVNGARFLIELQQSHPQISRFLVTGYSNLADQVDGIAELEADHYVVKPVNRDDLKWMCEEALAWK